MDVQQPNSPNKADVIFTVTEGKPGVLSAGAGYSSVDGLIGTLQVQHINFLGRGQRVNLQWQFGARTNSFDLGWTEPWLAGKPVSLAIDVFNTTRLQQLGTITNDYTTRDRGATFTIAPRFSDIYTLSLGYTLSDQRRYDVAPDSASRSAVLSPECANDPNCNEFHAIYSNITEQVVRDTRDNQFDPTRGTRTSLAVVEGGLFPGQAVKFYKPIAPTPASTSQPSGNLCCRSTGNGRMSNRTAIPQLQTSKRSSSTSADPTPSAAMRWARWAFPASMATPAAE